jgi:hypothetical protein
VLARVQRVRDKVDTVLGQNIGNTVVRATGKRSDYSAYVDPVSAKISLGDRFFTYRSPSPLSPNSQAGVFVHELSHAVQYNGKRCGTSPVKNSPLILFDFEPDSSAAMYPPEQHRHDLPHHARQRYRSGP